MTPDADRDKKIEKLRAQIDNLAKEDLILVAIEAGGTRSYSAHLPAHHHLRKIFGSSSCYKTDILVLSGRDKTDNTGVAKIPINSLLCGVVTEGDGLPPGWNFVMIREPNFVATPQSPLPCFATVVIHSTIRQSRSVPLYGRDDQSFNTGTVDVTVDITTWKHDGSPAPNTLFSWVCTVEVARTFPVYG